MTDERAKEISDKLRNAASGERKDLSDVDMAHFAARLYDDVEKLKQQQRFHFPTFGDAA